MRTYAAVVVVLLVAVALAGCDRLLHRGADDEGARPAPTAYDELAAPASGCPPLPPISGFVGRGDGALLYDAFAPFRATGTNLYYLQQLLTYAQQDKDARLAAAVGEVLDDLVCLSLPVARTWAFNDTPDRSAIRHGPRDYQEAGLRGLDQAVWEAKRRGIRLVMPLTNNWGDYGGLPAYAAWATLETGVPHGHDDFFGDDGGAMKRYWKDYVLLLADRVNTFTGVRYRDEPTILAWEIANELRCGSCRGTDRVAATVQELAAFLRWAMPNHLVADGGEGFDDHPALYAGLSNSYPVRGDEGTSFSALAALPELDMLSYHFYPKSYGLESVKDTALWIERHQAIAAVSGKVAYLGECGYVGGDAERAQRYDAWMDRLFDVEGGQLGLMWQLLPSARASSDGFAVYSRKDRATAWTLSRWGRVLR